MAYRKLAKLALGLYRETVDGRVDWEETTSSGVYQASFSNYAVTISLQESQDDEENNVRISIYNSEASMIESFSDSALDCDWFFEMDVTETPFKIMYELYEIARRTALGSEQAVNEILKELEDDDLPF